MRNWAESFWVYFWVYYLAVKYWAQGQEWAEAKEYAEAIVVGFRK